MASNLDGYQRLLLGIFTFFYLAKLTDSAQWTKADLGPTHDKHVVCYIGTWSVYRPGRGSFTIDDIDGKLCTHLVYAFVGLNATTNTLRSIDPYYDLEENYGKGSFKKMTQLKLKYPNLKVTLAVGGWNEGSLNYSTMALEPESRKKFINSVVDYVTRYNFDGFDLDWEFPGSRGGRKEDKQNFALLVKELKQELVKKNLILTAALGAAPNTIDTAYDIPEISKYLDLLHFMCYDYHGPWDKQVGANAPLTSNDNLDLESSIKHVLKLGAPPEKLVIGIPAYGHTFLTDNQTDSGIGTRVLGPGPEGALTKQQGFQGYNELCMEFLKTEGWSKYWDANSSTPYATNGNHVIAYDDERSIIEKVNLGLKYKVGGFMVWSIDTDDFHGDCERERLKIQDDQDKKYSYPLLKAVHRAIEQSTTQGDIVVPQVPTNEVDDSKESTSNNKVPASSSLRLQVPVALITTVIIFSVKCLS
ncbi:hypothetical protein RUM44_006411 [Polyplax serrata]|uniref:GH18 domain-containing protein n=1 Tax=Polyplax serrata TaxID=468196 RepID=A0ABR1AI11_POLSC